MPSGAIAPKMAKLTENPSKIVVDRSQGRHSQIDLGIVRKRLNAPDLLDIIGILVSGHSDCSVGTRKVARLAIGKKQLRLFNQTDIACF